eukprot:5057520-Amphidinium_carterae.1
MQCATQTHHAHSSNNMDLKIPGRTMQSTCWEYAKTFTDYVTMFPKQIYPLAKAKLTFMARRP